MWQRLMTNSISVSRNTRSSIIYRDFQRMNNAAKTEAAKEKNLELRKPPNPDALRAQEQKVTHDKVLVSIDS